MERSVKEEVKVVKKKTILVSKKNEIEDGGGQASLYIREAECRINRHVISYFWAKEVKQEVAPLHFLRNSFYQKYHEESTLKADMLSLNIAAHKELMEFLETISERLWFLISHFELWSLKLDGILQLWDERR